MPIYDQILQNFVDQANPSWAKWYAEEETRDHAARNFFEPIIEFVRTLNERIVGPSRGAINIEIAEITRMPGSINARLEIIFSSPYSKKSIIIDREGDSFSYNGNLWSTADSGIQHQILTDLRGVLLPPSPQNASVSRYRRI
jgi:hypothetical protein